MTKHYALISLVKTSGDDGCDVVIDGSLYWAKVVKASYDADELMNLRHEAQGDIKAVVSLNLIQAINAEILKIN